MLICVTAGIYQLNSQSINLAYQYVDARHHPVKYGITPATGKGLARLSSSRANW
jgi:hypothetical protein